jgi:hypothetical protein
MAGLKIIVSDTALKKFAERMKKLTAAQSAEFTESAVKALAAALLRRVKQKTPLYHKIKGDVNTPTKGQLRDGWTVGNVKKNGNTYEIEVFNNVEYAPYVEFGHRGVYVPSLGKTLHKDKRFTEGRFMLTVSEQELQTDAPGILTRKLSAFVKELGI